MTAVIPLSALLKYLFQPQPQYVTKPHQVVFVPTSNQTLATNHHQIIKWIIFQQWFVTVLEGTDKQYCPVDRGIRSEKKWYSKRQGKLCILFRRQFCFAYAEIRLHFRRTETKTHAPVYITGAEVEQVSSLRFLGISITENLSWTSHISILIKKA